MIVGQLKGSQIADNLALFVNLHQPLKDGGAHIGVVEIVRNNGIEDAGVPGKAHLQDVRTVGRAASGEYHRHHRHAQHKSP